jgi:fibro-slime domain-containing protein
MRRRARLALSCALALLAAGCPSGIAPTPDAGRDGGLDAWAPPALDAYLMRFDATLGPDAGELCGDGRRGITEACDDGGTLPGDGCNAVCEVEPGFRCPAAGGACRPVTCGDRLVEPPERCDDGNATPGDGCDAGCQPEPGWTCTIPGVACGAASCGDGLVAGFEQCDDGDAMAGDGCDASCRLEPGFACPTPSTACRATVCGDGVPEGLEQCDDGNVRAYDGCDPSCRNEPRCSGGVCGDVCGDGVLLPGGSEACDDGNTSSGDGCAADCTVEPGFTCTATPIPLPDRLSFPVVFRDFRGVTQAGSPTHPDFDARDGTGITFNMVEPRLDAEGRPVFSGLVVGGPGSVSFADFREWFRTGARNLAVDGSLVLDRLPGMSAYRFDSSAYFPLDGRGFTAPGAVGESYPAALPAVHNYGFTSELHTWFVYRGDERLEFRGDDDLWVFVDGQLCLDVGGLHGPEGAVMDFASPATDPRQAAIVTACRDRLTVGGVYELVVFHAERRCCGSNFALTLSRFEARTSTCDWRCGDGVVTRFELCDDGEGMNTGAYGRCGTDCRSRGPFCGDGLVEDGEEACDLGADRNDGRYDGCNPDCTRGPTCGDGVPQGPEECDAGPLNGADGSRCSATCQLTLG